MSCLNKERKPLVPTKTLDIIFRRRYVQNTQFYFTNRKHAVPEEKANETRSRFYCVPRSEQLLSYIKYSDHKAKLDSREKLHQPLPKKDNLRIAATRDISERLYLEEPQDDVRAVVEIHPEFYTVIEGRPLRSFGDIKVYTNNIRACAMNKQQIGYRRDLIMKLEQSAVDETVQYDKIAEELRLHIKHFQNFLTEDYKDACAKVLEAEQIVANVVAKNSEFIGYVTKLTMLNNVIFKLEAIRSVLKIYRKYLLFVAPLPWRQKFDESLKDHISSIQFEEGVFTTESGVVEFLDIDKMVEVARVELENPLPPYIYFTMPEQMMHLFRNMEIQSREYLMQISKSDVSFRMLHDRIKQLKLSTKQELDYFQYYVDRINAEIERESYNELYLQDKFFRILHYTFYNSVACPDTLKLRICIDFVYEQIFGKCEEGHQTLTDPMKILEVMYEDYNLHMDSLDFKVVTRAQKDFFAKDLKMMKNAYKAQRELRTFREMTSSMNKAFWPPLKYKKPTLKRCMDKKHFSALKSAEEKEECGIRHMSKNYKLSQEDKNGLLLFTNWCEGTDPMPYLKEYYEYVKPLFDCSPRKSVI